MVALGTTPTHKALCLTSLMSLYVICDLAGSFRGFVIPDAAAAAAGD